MTTVTLGKGDKYYYYITDSLRDKNSIPIEIINSNSLSEELNSSSRREDSSDVKSEDEITKSFISKSYNNSSSIDSDSLDEDEIIDKGETLLIKKKEKNTKFLNSLPMSLEEKRIYKDVEDAINRIENKKIKRFKDSCPYCKKKMKRKNYNYHCCIIHGGIGLSDEQKMRHVTAYSKKKIRKILPIIHDIKNMIKKNGINIKEIEINLKIIQEEVLNIINPNKKKIIFIRKKKLNNK